MSMRQSERVLDAMRRIGAPATASRIAREAKLPLSAVALELARLCEQKAVIRTMPSWGMVLYEKARQGEARRG